MDRKEELQRQIGKLRHELNDIEEAENEKKFSGLVGKCFTYRNCYSCPNSEKDYWLVYCRVISVTGSYANVVEFEIDSNGKPDIERNKCVSANMLIDSWSMIKESKLKAALTRFRRQVDRLIAEVSP